MYKEDLALNNLQGLIGLHPHTKTYVHTHMYTLTHVHIQIHTRIHEPGRKEAMNHESDGGTNCNWCTRNNPEIIGKYTWRLRNKSASRDHRDYSIIKIGQNIEESPGDLKRLTVSQTTVRNHQTTKRKLKKMKRETKYLNLARELKKLWNMKVTVIPNVIGALGTIPKGLVKGTGRVRNRWMNRDHRNYCTFEIGQNTEESPRDLRRLTVTQTPMKVHQLILVGKNSQDIIIIV